jgi:hypothetical protein
MKSPGHPPGLFLSGLSGSRDCAEVAKLPTGAAIRRCSGKSCRNAGHRQHVDALSHYAGV